jgi:hypothetical protein
LHYAFDGNGVTDEVNHAHNIWISLSILSHGKQTKAWVASYAGDPCFGFEF